MLRGRLMLDPQDGQGVNEEWSVVVFTLLFCKIPLWNKYGDPIYFSFSDIQLQFIAYNPLSHAIENTANQEARNPLHILRYATGSIPRKNPGVPCGLQIFPAERSNEEPATGQNFRSEKITVNN